ncbi:hypothetical protein IPG41_04490 [Candidatus Peregrinibacteria bacterium]|nr:MAG: hypothetical protein IPG41_04490 [Candidatus Peregrinibacteria bacterium]
MAVHPLISNWIDAPKVDLRNSDSFRDESGKLCEVFEYSQWHLADLEACYEEIEGVRLLIFKNALNPSDLSKNTGECSDLACRYKLAFQTKYPDVRAVVNYGQDDRFFTSEQAMHVWVNLHIHGGHNWIVDPSYKRVMTLQSSPYTSRGVHHEASWHTGDFGLISSRSYPLAMDKTGSLINFSWGQSTTLHAKFGLFFGRSAPSANGLHYATPHPDFLAQIGDPELVDRIREFERKIYAQIP